MAGLGEPRGPFVEVPYYVHLFWLAQPWAEVVEHRGFPPAVVKYLAAPHRDQIRAAVSGWESLDDYAAEHEGARSVPKGRAWLEPDDTGRLRIVAGTCSAAVLGRRAGRRWRW